jgi:hypothetical protein
MSLKQFQSQLLQESTERKRKLTQSNRRGFLGGNRVNRGLAAPLQENGGVVARPIVSTRVNYKSVLQKEPTKWYTQGGIKRKKPGEKKEVCFEMMLGRIEICVENSSIQR